MLKPSYIRSMGRRISNDSYTGPNHFLCRIYYVNNGTATIQYEKKQYTLTEGNIYIMPQSDAFSRTDAKDFDHTFFSFTCTPFLRSDAFIEIPGTFCALNEFFRFINSSLERNTVNEDGKMRLLSALLCILDNNMDLPYIRESIINRALDTIRKDTANVTVSGLAKELHVTEGYFIHLFTRTVGVPPMKYIRRLRLTEAESDLQAGMSVAEAAEKCGYKNPTAFWKAVHREFGCSPSQLKQK